MGAGGVVGVEAEFGTGGAEGAAVLGGGVDGDGEDAAGAEHFLGGGDAVRGFGEFWDRNSPGRRIGTFWGTPR